MGVDLHLHTNASDGTLSPEALMKWAQKRRLDVIAITDHDTTGAFAFLEGSVLPRLLPGVEITTVVDGEEIHLLGYLFDLNNAPLQALLAERRAARHIRFEAMLERLLTLGLPLDAEAVRAQAGNVPTRAHLARALMSLHVIDEMQDAFDLWLGKGRPALVELPDFPPEVAIEALHAAGGVAVLAHPSTRADYRELVARLAGAGLDGVEVVHPRNNYTVRQNLRALASQFELVMTGGSDFHTPYQGEHRPNTFTPPPGCVAALMERTERYRNLPHPPAPSP